MREFFDKMVSLGVGLALATRDQAEKLVDELVKRGEMAPEEGRRVVNELLDRGREEKDKLKELVGGQVKKVVRELDLVSREELNQMQKRVEILEARLEELEAKGNGEE